MFWSVRIAIVLTLLFSCPVTTSAEEPDSRVVVKVSIEFRWLESKSIKGITQEKGIRTTCGRQLSYPHQIPILTSKDVAKTKLTNTDLSRNGLSAENYMVYFYLNDGARQTLRASLGDKKLRVLAVFIDGRYWGAAAVRPESINELVLFAGMFSSKTLPNRIVATCK